MSFEISPNPDEPLRFIVRANKDKHLSQIKFVNNKLYKIGYKIKTTNQNIFMVKPGVGVVYPGTKTEVSLVMTPDKANGSDPSKERLAIEILDLDDKWEDGQLSELFKSRKDRATLYKMNIRLDYTDEQEMVDRASIENSGVNRDSVQPKTQTSEFYSVNAIQANQSIFQSALPVTADPEPARRAPSSSASEGEEQAENEVKDEWPQKCYEELYRKDIYISQLQEQKRKLETELGEWRSKSISAKSAAKPTGQTKAFEAWQIAGVLILAIFFGYFLGTK